MEHTEGGGSWQHGMGRCPGAGGMYESGKQGLCDVGLRNDPNCGGN